MKGAPKVRHAPIRGAKKIFGPFLVSRFSNDFILGVGRFAYFDKLTSMISFVKYTDSKWVKSSQIWEIKTEIFSNCLDIV